jgi:hypothetical protein
MSDEVIQNVPPQNVAPATPTESEKKACFYFSAFTEDEKLEYDRARESEGLDDEIILLKVKIKSLVKREPENISLLIRALTCLDRLSKTNKKVFKRGQLDAAKIRENTIALFKGINVPTEFIEKKFH